VLLEAARLAGMGGVTLVDEPVAAATYCLEVLGQRVAVGDCLVVFDFGGGTLDLAAVRREPDGLQVLATGGLEDLGGLDVDAALVGHLGHVVALRDPALWDRLTRPAGAVDLRDRRAFWSDVRAAKEMLSRTSSAPVQLPRVPEPIHLTREELERIAGPLVDRAVDETRRLLQRSGIGRERLAGVFLVGGSSRIPLVATRLHARLGVAPTVPEQPELPVAHGALVAAALTRTPAPPVVREEWGAVPQGPGPETTEVRAEFLPPALPPRRRGRGRLVAAAVVAVLLGLGATAAWWQVGRDGRAHAGSPSGQSPSGSPVAGSPGAASGVPAGFVRCGQPAGGYCPSAPICWGGLNFVGGKPVNNDPVPCAQAHIWQTFVAVGLPAEAGGQRVEAIAERSEVTAACTAAVMTARSAPTGATGGWVTDVMQQKMDGGGWIAHCLARPASGDEWRGSAFRAGV
jgi:hypothetical protein